MEERRETVLREFRELLRETKIITYKSLKMIHDNQQHLADILAVLEVCCFGYHFKILLKVSLFVVIIKQLSRNHMYLVGAFRMTKDILC